MARPSTPPPPAPARARRFGRRAKAARQGPSGIERFRETYKIARRHEPLILLWPLGGFVALVAIGVGLGFALGHTIIGPAIGAVLGALAGLNLFFYRAQRAVYAEAADKPGVAIQVVRQMRGDWKITEAVQFNRNQEFVHRVVGRPGVILLAEGRSRNVRELLAAEARRTRRIAPDVTVHEVVVGSRDGDVPLIKLRGHLGKLPRALKGPGIRALDVKLKAVANTSVPLPKGPLPTRMPRGKIR